MNTPDIFEGMSPTELLSLRDKAIRALSNRNLRPWDAFFDYHTTRLVIIAIDHKLESHGSGPQALR
jgi:hypothetical protein